MGTNTRVFDRKIKAQQAQARLKAKSDQELQSHLRAAAKGMGALQLPGDLTPEREIILLEQYVTRLEEEQAAFLVEFPGCTQGARWFDMSKGRSQERIAKLTIDNVQSEFEQENGQ